ncbi:IclR family transcriptional regulator [uncultured Parolsenella sp.]|uniref:IclR family transcriptional regulator n=1 Tax=uncultured Parolsenella sp. TaxID=2083008 RepID=UPI002597F18D|nr:IclR family transcriptional regulator [uncultured Parolsenella sp.]
MEAEDSTKLHRATCRVLELLGLLSKYEDGLTFTDVQRMTDIPKGTLSPMLHTMEYMNYISYDAVSGRYAIGVNTYLAGKVYGGSDPELHFIIEEMHRIVDACGETCQLGMLEGGNVAYIAKVDSPSPIRLISDVGKVFPAYCTAIGKAILSEKTRPEVNRLLPKKFTSFTANTITSANVLWDQLLEVRRTGFAHDYEEITDGVTCVAVPIHINGKAMYGMSVTTPSYRLDDTKLRLIESLLASAQQRIESPHN